MLRTVKTRLGAWVTTLSPAPLLNLLVSRKGYCVLRDLRYGDDARQKLDLYVPDGLNGPAPVVLFFYGGSWQGGEKAWYLAVGQALAAHKMIVAIADYRLYPQVKYPAFMEDGALAVKYLHDVVRAKGGDPEKLFLAGHSAGAYIAVMLAAHPQFLRAADAEPGWIKGVIGIAGPYDFLPLKDAALIDIFGGASEAASQPITYAQGAHVPMLLVTGTDDRTVRPRNVRRMAARLREGGTVVIEKTYPGTGHIGILLSFARPFRSRTTLLDDITDFVRARAF